MVRDIATPSYVHDPNHWFYLYTDEGSSNITLRDNWTPSEKFLKNANGPGNVWENNGCGCRQILIPYCCFTSAITKVLSIAPT